MKRSLPFLAVCLFGGTGCVVYHPLEQESLPPGWVAALQPAQKAPVDLTGNYRNNGESAGSSYSSSHRLGRSNLATNLFHELPVEKRRELSRAREVELRQSDATHLEITVRNGPDVLVSKTVAIVVDPNSCRVSLPSTDGLQTGKYGTAAYQSDDRSLFKGTDGCLYLDHRSGGAGVALVVVPVIGAQETWGRWEPLFALPP